MQIEYVLGELGNSSAANGYASYQLGAYNGYTVSGWKNATTPEDAAEAFCWVFEKPVAYDQVRSTKAREYYNRFKDATKPEGGTVQATVGDGYAQTYTSSTGRTYREYKQWMGSYAGLPFSYYPGCTISNSGCSLTAISIITSGYNNNQTPGTLASRTPVLSSLLAEGGTIVSEGAADAARLTSGKPALVYIEGNLVTEKGTVYYGEHFVAILDARNGNEVYVSDPGANDASSGGWTNVQNIINIAVGTVRYITN